MCLAAVLRDRAWLAVTSPAVVSARGYHPQTTHTSRGNAQVGQVNVHRRHSGHFSRPPARPDGILAFGQETNVAVIWFAGVLTRDGIRHTCFVLKS